MTNTDPFKNGGELFQLKTFSTLKTQRICDKVRGLKSCIDVLFIVSFLCYFMRYPNSILFFVNVLASLINTNQSTFIPFLTILQFCLD